MRKRRREKEGGKSQGLMAQACNLTTQEAEIRRIMGQSQPGQIVHKTLSSQKKKITRY
jgi:hypothetical protein